MPRRKQDKPKHCDESSEGEDTADIDCERMDNNEGDTKTFINADNDLDMGSNDVIDVEQQIDVDSVAEKDYNHADSPETQADSLETQADSLKTQADAIQTPVNQLKFNDVVEFEEQPGECLVEVEEKREIVEPVEEATSPKDTETLAEEHSHGEAGAISDKSEKSVSDSSSVKSAIPSFDCTEWAARLPSAELHEIHMMSHQPMTSNPTHKEKERENTPRPSIFGGPSVTSSSGVSYPPALIDSNDSMEEYMEIQKPENPHLEHLIKLEGQISDPNQCLICDRVLSCKSALMMHYRTHTGERPFRCKLCSRAFTTKGNLKTHMSVHRAKPPIRLLHNCPVCNKQFTNAIVLNQHIRLHSEEANQSRKRNMDLPNLREPKKLKLGCETGNDKPAISQIVNPFQLMLGPTMPSIQDHFRYAEALARQWDQLSQFSLFPSLASAAFPVCFPSFPNPAACSAPGMSIPSLHQQLNLSLPKPSEAHTGSVAATPTNSAKEEPLSLKSEPKDLTMNEPLPTQQLPNTISPRSEKSCESRGSSETHGVTARLEPPPGTACDICSKVFACRSALEIHYRSHTKQRPFKCELCDKAFTTRGNMKQHMLTHKSDDFAWGNFGETQDHNLLASARGLEDSFKSRGSSNNRHICNICNKNFSSASAVQIHFRTHTGDRPFKCTVCGKAFTTKGNLKVHMGTHMWNAPSRSSQDDFEVNDHDKKNPPSPPTPTPSSCHSYPGVKPESNNLLWGGLNPQALMKATSFFNNPAAMYPYAGVLSAPTSVDNETLAKPWLWRVTCHICNKDCNSPAALELHIQTHLGVDNSLNNQSLLKQYH